MPNDDENNDKPKPWDEQEAALKKAQFEHDLQKLQATSQLGLLKAQQDAITQLVPKSESKGPEGKIETNDKFGYLAEQVAYLALKDVGEKMCKALNAVLPKDAKILIVTSLDWATGDVPYLEVSLQSKSYQKQFDDLSTKFKEAFPPRTKGIAPLALPSVLLAAAPAVLNLASDLVGYFRTDYSVKGQSITLKTEALIAAVASKLKCHIQIADFNTLNDPNNPSELLNLFNTLHEKSMSLLTDKKRLDTQIAQPALAQVQRLQKRIAEQEKALDALNPNTDQEKIAIIKAKIEGLKNEQAPEQLKFNNANDLIEAADALLTAFTNFSKAITTATEAGKTSDLVRAVAREYVYGHSIDHLLYLSVLSSGGEAITRRTFWPWDAGWTSYLGGLVASYILARMDGKILATDIAQGLSAFDYNLGGNGKTSLRAISLDDK